MLYSNCIVMCDMLLLTALSPKANRLFWNKQQYSNRPTPIRETDMTESGKKKLG